MSRPGSTFISGNTSSPYLSSPQTGFPADRDPLTSSATESLRITELERVIRHLKTELKNKDATIHQLGEELSELTATNQNLKQFASTVAHDLHSPVRHLRFLTGTLRKNLLTTTSEETTYNLGRIDQCLTVMRNLIDALLGYARLGQKHFKPKSVNLATCMSVALELYAQDIMEQGVSVEVDAQSRVWGDESLIVQLFQNLISNALKYQNPEEPLKLVIITTQQDTHVKIKVTDNGLGIPPELSEQIFGLFQRAHTSKHFVGLGMGLALCRKICEIHGGDIRLVPKDSSGAQFIIRLPAYAEAQS